MSRAAAANWPVAPMVGHPRIAFRRRHSTASPHNLPRLCRNSPSIPSVRAGSGPTWADRTPPVQLGKEPRASSGSPWTLRKTKPVSYGAIAKSFHGERDSCPKHQRAALVTRDRWFVTQLIDEPQLALVRLVGARLFLS